MNQILAHRGADSVAVAVDDLRAGEEATGLALDGSVAIAVRTRDAIPLGHKVALRDVPAGGEVIEYGVAVGEATAEIHAGDHVHVHNLRSIRWRASQRPALATAQG